MLITERRSGRRGGVLPDLVAVAGAAMLVAVAALLGWRLIGAGVDIDLGFPPLLARWLPHVGPGTPVAVAVAGLVATNGPGLAARLRWRTLLWAAYPTAVLWTLALAMVDGWQRGVAGRLATRDEYLHDVPLVGDVPLMLRTFSDHILTTAVDPGQSWFWTTHVGAHPPLAFLLFVWLDRVGLGGGGPAGVSVILVGASACVAVAVTLRSLGAEQVARRALPFGVLLPGAVWVGVSADGLFAGVLAWSVALVAVGCAGRGLRSGVAAVAGGALYGCCLYLSYGLALGVLLPLAVLVGTGAGRAAVLAASGLAVVVLAFTASGFWWFTGYTDVKVIYAASIAASRPYLYFGLADIAAVLFAAGPALVAGIRRAVAAPGAVPRPAALLAGAAVAAILLADLSGMSKGEVERIWLPFVVWLVPLAALLGRPAAPRAWLLGQAVLALAVNHLLLTVW
ncbi:MAG: methylthioxylose transferase [Pseudonocardiales bacterium]|nr:methylthioxylose transferase [Pseudonocardiales bacterium]